MGFTIESYYFPNIRAIASMQKELFHATSNVVGTDSKIAVPFVSVFEIQLHSTPLV
jgi:hypothetical protein